jgi:hypothetical protein
MKEQSDQIPLKPASWRISMSMRSDKCMLLGPILALLLLGYGFGAEWEDPPPGQPVQMSSKVDYDPKLADSFFLSNEWSHPGIGGPVTVRDMDPGGEVPLIRHTAKCFSTSFGPKHQVRFCEARLVNANMIDLFIHDSTPAFDDRLIVQIRNEMFSCQYWTYYRAGPTKGLTWTTARQGLTLDKKNYRKGDVIKGKIDVEISEKLIHPKYPNSTPGTIAVYGVFKTVVE